MGSYGIQRERSLVEDAITFATEESRYSYEPKFYVPQSELDGKVHRLDVTMPGKRRYVAALPKWIRRGGQNGDGGIMLDATRKQWARVQETARVPAPETPTGIVRYVRAVKLSKGAVLLRIRIRDQESCRFTRYPDRKA